MNTLRARRKITFTLWRERRAGRCKAPRRRRCGVIVEERQRSRCPPAATPRQAAGPQARWLCCSLLTCNPACSSLAPRQWAWGPAAKWVCYYVTDPKRSQCLICTGARACIACPVRNARWLTAYALMLKSPKRASPLTPPPADNGSRVG